MSASLFLSVCLTALGVGVVLAIGSTSYAADAGVEPDQATRTTYPSGGDCFGRTATIRGTPGADRIIGTDGDDVIVAGPGDDRVFAMGGDDIVCSGGGDDRVRGGLGDDVLLGGSGNDELYGGAGRDLQWGEGGRDRLYGSPGRDHLAGGAGFDRVDYRSSPAAIRIDLDQYDPVFFENGRGGHAEGDVVHSDRIDGSAFDDRFLGNSLDNVFVGGPGADFARGYRGLDHCPGVERRLSCETP